MTAPSHWDDLKGTPPPSSDPINIVDTETHVSNYKRDRSNSPALSIKSTRHSVYDDVKSTAPSRNGSDDEERGENESDSSESSTSSSPIMAPVALSLAVLPSSPRTPPPLSRAKRARAREAHRLDATPKAISRTVSMSAYDGFKSPIPFRLFAEGYLGELKRPDPLNLSSRGDAWSDQEDGIINNGEPTTRFFGPPPTSRLPHAIHGSAESAEPVPSGTPATFFAGSSSLNDVTPDVTHDVTGDVMTQPQESRPVQPQLPDLKDPANTATEETLVVSDAAFKALEALKYITNFFTHRVALNVRPGENDPRFPQMGEPIYCLLTSMFNSGWDRLPINGESGLTITEALRQYLSPQPVIPMTDSSPPPQGKGKGKKVSKPPKSTTTPLFPPGIVVGQSNPTDRIDHDAMNIDQAPPAEGTLPIPQNDVSSSGKTHDVSSVLNSQKAKNDVKSSKPNVSSVRVSRAPPPLSHHVTPRNGNGNFERSVGRPSSDGQAQSSKLNPKSAPDMPLPIPVPDRKASTKPLTEHFNKKTSFADAARRGVQPTSSTSTSSNIDGVKMREMILAFPDLSYDKVLAMYKASFGSAQSQAPELTSTTSAIRAKPKMTTHGPTRRQVLIPFEGNIIADRIKDFNKASEFCNRGLTAAQSKLRVESVRESYNGISIATSGVATSADLETIKSWLKKAWQLGDAIPVEPRLPQSKSFLKIVGVPYWVANSSNPLSPAFVEQALSQSSLFENVILAARPRVMKASPKSDTAVVWFDIWDSQNGTKAKTLVNRTINFGRHIGTIRATSMHPGVAQCRNCWRWGHPTHANPKSSPPRDATPDGIPCPHLENFKCLNCKGDHHANDNKCPFWRNRFDRTWHSNKAAESRTARANNLISSVRIYSQNVGCSYALVDIILESRKLDFDIIFLQEPPWNHIRKAPSTTNPEGDDVIGAPIHPEWLCMARPTKPNDPRPRTLTYVHRRLSRMRPILRQEWVNHRDIQILGLFNNGNYIHLLNIYSDSSSSAINFLSTNFIDIPNIIYMGGDFNCRSPEWDPSASHVPQSATTLTELVDCFNLSRSEPTFFSPTHFSSVENYDNTVIDLIFCANASISHIIDANSRLPSDHAPLLMDLPIRPDFINYKKCVLPKDSDEETAFISQVSERLAALDCSNIYSISCLDNISQSISCILSDSWNSNSKTVWITNRSKEWWTPHCSETLITYRKSKDQKDWRAFRKATRVAKRSFFDERIHEIASTNKRPWDLMEWVKQRKLPAIEGIRYQGRPCNDLPDLWNALPSSYNSASGRPRLDPIMFHGNT
ncbi:hypothetical protein D9756_011009 [Leucocoprinus leucothites]|uniref:Endonuclease/exonuclease/phosphatase domain-containing protein n=1 Tax=Leucocoprinus leucothites TaxID=201217 RepID=A0A8H5FS11_9AGAR|nr:hypothetical protein D9756_011009 [Leucoagaricus leucothites]